MSNLRQTKYRILSWRDNFERELLLGDLIGKFNNLVDVEDCTLSVDTNNSCSDSADGVLKLRLGDCKEAQYWRVNSTFTDQTRIICTLFADSDCTQIH